MGKVVEKVACSFTADILRLICILDSIFSCPMPIPPTHHHPPGYVVLLVCIRNILYIRIDQPFVVSELFITCMVG